MITSAQFCEKICRIATNAGWQIDAMHTLLGHSYASYRAKDSA